MGVGMSKELMETCFICDQDYYFTSHLTDSTPTQPRKRCKACYDAYTNETMKGLPSSTEMIESLKAKEEYTSKIYGYILKAKKLMKSGNLQLKQMVSLLLCVEELCCIEMFKRPRGFLSKQEHLSVINESSLLLGLDDVNSFVVMTNKDSDKYKQLYYAYLKHCF